MVPTQEILKVYNIGSKRGLFFTRDLMKKLGLRKGELISLSVCKGDKRETFLSRFNEVMAIRRDVETNLQLKAGDSLTIIFRRLPILERVPRLITDGKVDLLSIIPIVTSKGFSIVGEEYLHKNEKWIRIWAFHDRGSSRQIELKRFFDIKDFGRFLGQMQAEGTKFNFERLEFCNKSINEHKDFVTYLRKMGISEKLILSRCEYHKEFLDMGSKIKEFEKEVGIKVSSSYGSKSRRGYGFKTFIRSNIITEIVLNSLDIVRKKLIVGNWDESLRVLADGFFAKILSGDGNIEIITKNRKTPQARIKIVDGNCEYLKDYAEIMRIYGLKPKIHFKNKMVRSYLNNPEVVKTLISIGAFEGNPNMEKLKFLNNLAKANKGAYNSTL